MIEFTIKTLDSNNHSFTVEDETTIQQLKEKIREQMGIDINLQRLIFCGRVLQDEKRLSDYDVHGKVVHLVQRAPPSPESRHSTYSANNGGASTESNNANPQPRRPNPLASIIREDQASSSPTSGRLEFIRLMVSEIRSALASLQTQPGEDSAAPASGEANVENMETDPTPNATQEEGDSTLEEGAETAAETAARASHARRRSYRAIRALRARHSRPRDLGQLMEELEQLQEQFAPYRAQYTRLLMAANSAEPPIYTEEERQSAQRTVDIVSDIMHSFAHAYHAVSDINFQVGQRNPRLTSEASVMRHPLPMQQAHINVVQSNRRPGQNGAATVPATAGGAAAQNATATTATATTAAATTAPVTTAAATTATATTATATAATAISSTVTSPAATATGTSTTTSSSTTTSFATPATGNGENQTILGRNTTQPTVNINIHPDPVTYQVEIETRVPIAFALENALLNGLANPVAVANAAATAAGTATVPTNTTATAQDGQTQPNQTSQPQQARRQVLFDFENLFRGLGQGGSLGGVEVVMSMEEIPNGGIVGQVPLSQATAPVGNQAPPTLQAIGSVHQPDAGAGVFVGPMPWGGAPSADLLQNIVSSVIRQGLLPGVEAVALQVAHSMPNAPTATATGDQPASQAQNGAQNAQTAAGRHANLHLRRATTTTRAHAVTLNNFIYDRFLLCVSPHARRRLLRRREQQQHQAAAHARARADRAAAQNIEVLRERNPNFTQNHMQTMIDLLTSQPSPATFTNAFLVAVARHLFLAEPMQIVSGEPALVPNEFQPLRQMLRIFLQEQLVRSGGVQSDHTFETVADFLVDEHVEFLRRVDTIVPLRSEFNLIASMRALIASRLPAIVASVMSESNTEAFVARFYAMFSHLFTDICTLVAYCCRDGVDGLRTAFRAFMEEKVRNLGNDDVQQVIITLGMENLGVVINSLNAITQVDPIQQFVIRNPPSASAAPQEPTPMEVSPTAADEPPALEPNEEAAVAPAPPPPAPAPAPATAAAPAPAPVPAPAPAPVAPTSASDVTSTTSDGEACASRQESNEAVPAHEPQPSRSAPSESSRPSRPECDTPPQRTSPDSQSNTMGFVPPVLLLQHWGEEWVPVFTRDQRNMTEAQEPYSDAYLSGMPSRKRRCVRQSRPQTFESFINESVREASERPAPVDSDSVRRAFREHMRNMARSRASSSEDYDPMRYASAARFLNTNESKEASPAKKSEEKPK